MPCSCANVDTRSVISPGARNQGAITSRRAPCRRSEPAARATDCSRRVAKAVVAPAHSVPDASVHDHAEVVVVWGHPEFGEALAQHRHQPVVLAEDVRLPDAVGAGARDLLGNVVARMVCLGE